MRDLNQVTLIGRLVRDVEVRQITSDLRVANFSIANNYTRKRGESYEEDVSFIDCEAFRGWEAIEPYLLKGKQIAVHGVLRQDRWEDADGNKRNKVKILVDTIQLLGGPGEPAGESTAVAPAALETQPAPSGATERDFSDDIPF